MDMEETVENYFGDIVGQRPKKVDGEALDSFNDRYDNMPVDEFLAVDEENFTDVEDKSDLGVVFYDDEDAAYVSGVDVVEGDIYMEIDEVSEKSEMLHGLARKFVEYGEPELGEWETEELL